MSILAGKIYGCDRSGCETVRTTTDGWVAVLTDRQGTLHVHAWVVAEQAGLLPFARHYCSVGHGQLAVTDAMSGAAEEAKVAVREQVTK